MALAVAPKTGKRIGLDTSTRMAINAVFALDREPAARRASVDLARRLRPVDELTRIVGPKLKPFRIQFVGAAPDGGKSVSKEVEIRASDRSAAIVAAANLVVWPPETIGLRILDGAGREVFGRQSADRR